MSEFTLSLIYYKVKPSFVTIPSGRLPRAEINLAIATCPPLASAAIRPSGALGPRITHLDVTTWKLAQPKHPFMALYTKE